LSFCSEEEITFLDAIEAYTGEEILRYDIDNKDYMSIIEDTEDLNYNWKKLIEENSDPNEWKD
jgi:hypothetical protein